MGRFRHLLLGRSILHLFLCLQLFRFRVFLFLFVAHAGNVNSFTGCVNGLLRHG